MKHPLRHSRTLLQKAAIPAAAALALSPALAQEEAQSRTLDPVVVTASPQEQRLQNAPASISVIGRQALERSAQRSLNEVLKGVEGLSVVGSDPSVQDINVRGLPGEYTLMLVDGQRENIRETMNRSSAGVQSQLMPPLSAIERIEVVRGPMSSIYGADAMGGVVNIITRKFPKRLTGSVSLGGVWQQQSDRGNTRNLDFWLGAPLLDGRVGLQLSGRLMRRDEDHVYYDRSGTSGSPGTNTPSLGARLSAKIDARQDLTLDLNQDQLTSISTPGISGPATTPALASRLVTRTEFTHQHWGLTHTGRWSSGSSEILLYGDKGQQRNWTATGPTAAAPVIGTTVLEGRWKMPWGEREQHFLTLGAQASQSTLSGASRQDAVPGGYDANPDRLSRTSWALYAENRFSVWPGLDLTGGLRMDQDERYGRHFSPRLYAVYQAAPGWTVRGGIATGFRPPTLRQSTSGYCMTTGGVAGATPGTLCGNSQLKPESSLSQELGVRYDKDGRSLSATLFHSLFKNKVASYDTGVADPKTAGSNIYVYDNIDRVRIQGLELSASSPLTPSLSWTGTYTLTQSERQGSGENAFNGSSLNGLPLDLTPRHAASTRLNWQAGPDTALFAQLNYSGPQIWAAFRNGALAPRNRAGSSTLDLGAHHRFSSTWSVNASLLNLTNRQVPIDDRGRMEGLNGNWMVDEGRRVAVSLTGQF